MIYNRAVVTNVGNDGLFEIIIYEDSDEKAANYKVREVHTDLVSFRPSEPKEIMDMVDKLSTVMLLFKQEINGLSLDERDDYPNFEGMVKRIIGKIPKNDMEYYQDLLETAKNAVDKASDLAYTYRVGSTMDIAKAEEAFRVAKDDL